MAQLRGLVCMKASECTYVDFASPDYWIYELCRMIKGFSPTVVKLIMEHVCYIYITIILALRGR